MDMIDILGGMLGQKTSAPGKGTDILKDIFGRGRQPSSRGSSIPTADQIERSSKELEEMLNVANDRNASHGGGPSNRAGQGPQPVPGGKAIPQPAPTSRYPSSESRQPSAAPSNSSSASGDRALVLVRAMVNAAKSDGQIDQAEQQSILGRLSDRSQETIDFLRQEFARPLDLQEFVRSVPLGMEEQVYMLSLITIDLDTSSEAKYLTALGEALRISPEVRNQIHTKVGAPNLF